MNVAPGKSVVPSNTEVDFTEVYFCKVNFSNLPMPFSMRRQEIQVCISLRLMTWSDPVGGFIVMCADDTVDGCR